MIYFDINSVVNTIQKANLYLVNACSVQASTASASTQDIIQAKEEQKESEKRIQEECDKKIANYAKFAAECESKDGVYLRKINELNEKLKRVDKKYAKIESSLLFAGITENMKKEILRLIIGEDVVDETIVEKIFDFFKSISHRYIAKPISPILIVSKKRRKIYEQLAACKAIASEYIEINKKYYIDRRDEDIKSAKDDAAQQVFNLRKRFDARLNTMMQDIATDNAFLLEESVKTLSSYFNEEFYEYYNKIKSDVQRSLTGINEKDDFPEQLVIGDIAWMLSNEVLNSPIGKAFVSQNEQLFEDGTAFIPWTLKLSDCQSIFISPSSTLNKESINTLINQIIYSLMRQLPLNGIELSVFDPDRRGNSIYPFLNLPTQLPEMFSKKIFTSTEDICYRIQELNMYVDSVIQQKLSNRYSNVFEYNKATPDNPLPIKVVCIFDFPKFFDGKSYEYLTSIIKNSARCGIFVIIAFNPSEMKNGYNNEMTFINEIKKESIGLMQTNDVLYIENTGYAILPIELPKQSEIDEFCISYERASKKKLTKGIPFITVVKEGDFFTKKSADYISLPVGKGDGSATQFIEFGKRSSQHAIITGATGSGKSTLLHTLIMSALINYSPDEINLYLMDFKSGTEFKVYETIKVPHIKLLALDALQEFGESILIELVEEQNRRSQLFKDNGEHTSLKSYVTATGQKMPRILVIMDEFQILFNESSNRKVAAHCAELANKIVTEGRAFGIHLVMATQTLRSIREKTALSNSTIEQMRIRIGLKCGEDDATYIFGDDNAHDALLKMKGAIGTAVYNPEYTEACNSGFRVAYCDDAEQKVLLTSIANACKGKYEITTKVFEGKRVPELPMRLLDPQITNDEINMQIGEPIRIEMPVTVSFTKKKNNNLLIIGSDTVLMAKIVNILAIEASRLNDVQSHFIDGNAFFDEPLDPYIEKLNANYENITIVSTRKDVLLFIEELYEEFKKRRRSSSASSTRHIVFINGLQYIDILTMILKGDYINREDYIESESEKDSVRDSFDFDSAPETIQYSTALKELIELGYAYGIFFIVTCNEYQTVKDVLHYGAGLLSKFTNRIIFAISDKDSDDLIDGIQLSGMNDVTAVYTDGIKKTMQFKPYAVPSIEKI